MKIFWIVSQILVVALVSLLMLLIFGLAMFGMDGIREVTAVSVGSAFKNEGLLIASQITVMFIAAFYVLTYTFSGYAVRNRQKFSQWMILLLLADMILMTIRSIFVPMVARTISWDSAYEEPSFSHHPFIFISSVLAICMMVLLKRHHTDCILHPKLTKRVFYIVCISLLLVNVGLRIFVSYEPEPFFG